MENRDIVDLLKEQIEKENKILRDFNSLSYELVEAAMRRNVYAVTIDVINDSENELEYSEQDFNEFVQDVDYMVVSFYNHMWDTFDVSDWETRIAKQVFSRD